MTETTKITAPPESGLDIIVFVAHLKLTAADLDALIDRMLGELKWPSLSARICLVVSDSTEFEAAADRPVLVIRTSAAAAMFRDRCRVLEASPHDVLVAFGAYLPTVDTLVQLRAAARQDEMVSAVVPRIAVGPSGELMALGLPSAQSGSGLLDPRYASKLAAAYHLPEMLCPCMLITGRMIGNIDVPGDFDHFPALILALLRAGRRRGLLLRIDNRSTVAADAKFEAEALEQEAEKMLQQFDDYEVFERRLAANPAFADERRFQLLRRPRPAVAGSLLLDCTNLPPSFNGSAEHTLGVLKGITQLGHAAWDTAAMVNEEARRFFSLDDRFPGIRFLPKTDESYFDCAIRLSQPWLMSALADLNRRARSIAVTILDTIGPDVIYPVPEQSEEAFQFAAEHADGLIYISEFSRDQFRRRFVARPDLVESVIYLSLDPAEYVPSPGNSEGEWILIFGNAYDHKDLERTTKIVSAAFPFEKIKVVGNRELSGFQVEAFDSGALENEFIEQLFAGAKCVLFPSFYEGFGLPLIRGLAYGKTVIARRSAVFHEIVARFPNIGRLVEFENSLELVPILGKVLRGQAEAVPRPVTAASSVVSYDWKKCAAQILEFAEAMRTSENVEVWRKRDRALGYVSARLP